MAVSTIALYGTPPTTTTPYHCSNSSHDFDINARSSSSTSTSSSSSSSSSQKPVIGGLSSLFSSSSAVKHASPSSAVVDDSKLDDFACSFSYHSLRRDPSPVSVFNHPLSATSSPGFRTIGSDFTGSGRVGSSYGLFHGFIGRAASSASASSCVDYDSPCFEQIINDYTSCDDQLDDLTFHMDDNFVDSNYAKDLLLYAQSKHEIFYDHLVINAFYEAHKAHRGQVHQSCTGFQHLFISLFMTLVICADFFFLCEFCRYEQVGILIYIIVWRLQFCLR